MLRQEIYLRVITGLAKGRKLKAPKGMLTRPTSDRVKEALFNVLGERVVEARFLDLFAGSGNVGIEALSRGAVRAVFVEQNPRALQVLRENLETVGFQEQAQVLGQDVIRALDFLGKKQAEFDLIYVDPPYLKGFEQGVLEKVSQYGLMADGGILVIESSKRDLLPSEAGRLELYRTQDYGDTSLSYYRFKTHIDSREGANQ